MMRCRAALEGLDDVHATATTRARVGWVVCRRCVIGGLLGRRRLDRCGRSNQLTRPCDGLGLGAARQQAAVPYPVESAWQDVDQEPPDELVRLERHGLVAAGSLDRPREEAAGTQQMRSRVPFALRTVQSFFCRAEKESLTGRALVPLGISQRSRQG